MHELISQPQYKITAKATRGDVFLTKSWRLLIHFANRPSHHEALKDFGLQEQDLILSGHLHWRDDRYVFMWKSTNCVELDNEICADLCREVERRIRLKTPAMVYQEIQDIKTRRFYVAKRQSKRKHLRRAWRQGEPSGGFPAFISE